VTKVQHTVRLHEETVQKIAVEGLSIKQRRHTTSTKSTRWGVTVKAEVMKVARRVRRPGTTIRIINEGTVLIVNNKENQ
jgi:hypothetical protein